MKSSNLIGLDVDELIKVAKSLGRKDFRGKQLYHQIYRRRTFDFSEMTDLSKAFREELSREYSLQLPEVVRQNVSQDGTVKWLLRLEDGEHIESVLIPEESRNTLCISSQVGCAVGCTFCQTAQMGFRRNLKTGEILGQVLRAIETGFLRAQGFNIVFMGMGEPLYNYQNVMKAYRLLIDSEGMDLSNRKITLSTAGVVPVLEKMVEEDAIPNLAISLNATTAETRDRIMPINRKWGVDELLEICRRFPLEKRQRITFEYVLLKGENDSVDDARRLATLLRGIHCKVNLIPYNPNPGLPHARPDEQRVERFRRELHDREVAAFVRQTRGDDVSAACGQLAYLEEQEQEVESVSL